MTHAEIQQRISHIEATIEYKIREVMELMNERRQLQSQLAGAKTLDDVIEMAEDDIRCLYRGGNLTVEVDPINRKAIVYRSCWQYPDIRYNAKAEAMVNDGDPIEVALATAMRIAVGWPIPKEYLPYLTYTNFEE